MKRFCGALALLFQTIMASSTQAQTLSDGPYVEWLANGNARVESICDSKVYTSLLEGPGPLVLKDLCTNKTISVIGGDRVAPPDNFTGVERFFALSDVEGHYDEMITLLQKQGIVNAQKQWIWGDGHLVFLGDMVDRGAFVTEVLWFLHSLEQQALKAGGRVHYLLGNHEKMALEGDVRYINKKYNGVTALLDRSYQDLFATNTEFGQWFRSRNVLLKLNDTLFVHGGLSPDFARTDLDLPTINKAIRLGLTKPEIKTSDAQVKWLLSSQGPLWYRGYFQDESLRPEDISPVLEHFGTARVVVGHTIFPEIQSHHEGLVLSIDTSFAKPERIQGLLFDHGRFYKAGIQGKREILPLP